MQIHRLDPTSASDDDLRPAAAVLGAAEGERHALPPLPAAVAVAQARSLEPSCERHVLVAGSLDDPDGAAVVDLHCGAVNRHVAHLTLAVAPGRRRGGVGRALAERVAQDGAAEGRTLLVTSGTSLSPAAGPFAAALGFAPGLVMRINRLELSALDHGLLDRWIADAPASYELVQVDGEVPEELIETFIAAADAMNDAPLDDLDVEDEVTTADHVRAREARRRAMGVRQLLLVARHRGTGAAAGFTNVRWSAHHPTVLLQGGTATRREHRGHGLGRWMKAEMLRWALRELPAIEEVRTENAHTNPWMLAINDALGFAPWAEETVYQRRLG